MSGVVVGVPTMVVILHQLQPRGGHSHINVEKTAQIKLAEYLHAHIVQRSAQRQDIIHDDTTHGDQVTENWRAY